MLLDLLMRSGFIAVRAKLFDFQPFCSVPTVFLSCVPRNPRGAFGGIGPAFSALKSDHDPDALVFSHKGRSAVGAKGNNNLISYKVTIQFDQHGRHSLGS